MIVTLKMTIEDQEFTLKLNMTMNACRIYRQQYGRDALKDMAEIYDIVNPSPFDAINYSEIAVDGKTEEELYNEVISKAMPIYFARRKKETSLDYETAERACKLIWAFAKNAGEKQEYEEWIESFDYVFPYEEIITALYEAWHKSAKPTVELKN